MPQIKREHKLLLCAKEKSHFKTALRLTNNVILLNLRFLTSSHYYFHNNQSAHVAQTKQPETTSKRKSRATMKPYFTNIIPGPLSTSTTSLRTRRNPAADEFARLHI